MTHRLDRTISALAAAAFLAASLTACGQDDGPDTSTGPGKAAASSSASAGPTTSYDQYDLADTKGLYAEAAENLDAVTDVSLSVAGPGETQVYVFTGEDVLLKVLSSNGAMVETLVVDGRMYVKAPARWWDERPLVTAKDARLMAGTWIGYSSDSSKDLPQIVTRDQVLEMVTGGLTKARATETKEPMTEIDFEGVPALLNEGQTGRAVLAGDPLLPLSLGPLDGGDGTITFSYDVEPLTAPTDFVLYKDIMRESLRLDDLSDL